MKVIAFSLSPTNSGSFYWLKRVSLIRVASPEIRKTLRIFLHLDFIWHSSPIHSQTSTLKSFTTQCLYKIHKFFADLTKNLILTKLRSWTLLWEKADKGEKKPKKIAVIMCWRKQ